MSQPLPTDPDRRFQDLVDRARRDVPAPIDTAALLRALRQPPSATITSGWWGEFAALFNSWYSLTTCSAGAMASLAFVGWLAWDAWHQFLPWAQLLGDSDLFS